MKKVTYLLTWKNNDGTSGEQWLNCDAQTADKLASLFLASSADAACVSLTPAEDLAY